MARMEDDDDFFGPQEEDSGGTIDNIRSPNLAIQSLEMSGGQIEFQSMLQRELLAKEDELRKVGFLDAYDEFKESRLQDGFEFGTMETFEAGCNIGKLLGKVSTLQKLKVDVNEENPRNLVDGQRVHAIAVAITEFFVSTFQRDDSLDCKQLLEALVNNLEQMQQ
jgi:hypothetical protein